MKADEGDEQDRKMFSVCTGNADLHILGAFPASLFGCCFFFFYLRKRTKCKTYLITEIFTESEVDYLLITHSRLSSSSLLFHRLTLTCHLHDLMFVTALSVGPVSHQRSICFESLGFKQWPSTCSITYQCGANNIINPYGENQATSNKIK